MQVGYNSIVPSSVDGTDSLKRTTREFIEASEGFRMDVHIQEVLVTEHDTANVASDSKTMLSIEREPTIITSVMPAGFEAFLGIIWFYEEDVEMNINIYRERWLEHLAYVAGLNLFWFIIFYCCLKCFVRNQFHASLRKEIDPNVVKAADDDLNGNPITKFRRMFCAGTGLGVTSSEEDRLDTEMTSHLSYKNLFHSSKLVQMQ